MARFFIDRPVFAWVISLLIVLAGVLAIRFLPVAQYPDIAPPVVNVSASYPGASAKVVEEAVTAIIEREMNGAPGLLYTKATSSTGQASLTLTFRQGVNADLAAVEVQNRLKIVESRLPESVRRDGIYVEKAADSIQLIVTLTSSSGRYDAMELGEIASSNVLQALRRVEGVGKVETWGAEYAMRIWPDPAKLTSMNLSASDLVNAVRRHNARLTVGDIGNLGVPDSAPISATVKVDDTLVTPEQFGEIPLRIRADGGAIRLRDVARVEFGQSEYGFVSRVNQMTATGLAVKMAPGSNAVATAKRIRATLDELSRYFPEGVSYNIPYDTSAFVEISIRKVVSTLLEAMLLVFAVMYLFMQNFRATLIPTLVVPVALLGTFTVMLGLGFSINVLTMFGMVLAIGILVDDAIIVVENVERVMAEEGLSPREAARKSMGQIQGALVGIAMVLSAVFLPMAFFGGSTGVIYRQFSITIVSAMALSVIVALILTPALCATMLKPIEKGDHGEHKGGFFGWFNRMFLSTTHGYERGVASILKHRAPYLLIYVVIVAGMIWMFTRIPTAFLPDEDQGVLFAQVQTPPGSSAERTQVVVDSMREYLLEKESSSVSSVFTVTGFNFAGRGQSSGMAFIMLKPWEERPGGENSVFELAKRAQMHFFSFKDAMVFAFAPPSVLELGNATGFDLFLQDQAGVGHEVLLQARNKFLMLAAQNPALQRVRPNGMSDEPQYKLEIDDEKASALGVSLADINSTVSIAWGSSYVNDFIDRGRVKRVYLQGRPDARMNPDDLSKWYVRNDKGEMVPFNAFATGKWEYGSPKLERYNGVPAMEILGEPAPGLSSGDAMAAVEEIVKQLPKGVGYSWTGLSYEERLSGSQAPALYALSLLVVFLCLAALYESWSIPFSVMLVVPLGVIGALLATSMRGLSNDVFFQVGLLTTIGLSAKNAILIVEFAKELHEQGKGIVEAAIEACRMRLRPIVMTSLAFILGVVPLAISTGAGSGSQHAIGTGVIGGMVTATVLAIFWVPLFYVAVSTLFKDEASKQQASVEKGQ